MDVLAEDFDFSALPDAVAEAGPDIPGEVSSEDKTPETKTCPVCNLEIVRAPGSRGRMAKYHPECKPSATNRVRTTLAGSGTTGTNTKKEREADQCVAMIKPQLVRGAMAAMLVDKYDGFVVMTNIPNLCQQIRGILVSHDKLREDVLKMRQGGSILGLIISLAMMVLPILAHHGLIPSVRLRQMLSEMPVVIFKISQRLKEGEQAMNDMMERVANEALRPKKTGQEGSRNGYTNPNATSTPDAEPFSFLGQPS